MTHPVMLLIGLVAVFAGVFAASLALITGGQERTWISRTVSAVGRGYRIRHAPADPPSGERAVTVRWGIPAAAQLAVFAGRFTPAGRIARLKLRLDQAGNPGSLPIGVVMEYKGLLLVMGTIAGLLGGSLVGGPVSVALATAGGAGLGFFAPDLLVTHLAQTRQQDIRRTLPDIIDTLVVTVEAGLGFEASVAHVVRLGRGPLVGEFARVLHEMRLGRPRVEAVRAIAARTTVVELRGFAAAVVQATTLGVPLGAVLNQQAAEMRLRRRQRAEEQAQQVPVKILFPMVLCIFPALFVVTLGPGLLKALQVMSH